jgi:pSer/pThr/pTyr-binding forkhead associated (FHA) protein
MPSLIVSIPDEPEVTHELTEKVITLGRVSDNTLQIEHASVSSHHAELTLRGENYALKDLGSTNGTRVNGHTIEPEQEVPLNPNDVIEFGHIDVRYVTDATSDLQPLPAEAEPASAPASSSVVPTDFANASPFQKKTEKKDPANLAVLILGIVALLCSLAAIVTVLGMKSPL